MDRDYLEAFLLIRSVPQTKGPPERNYKEMIFIAINDATTHLHASGVHRHIQTLKSSYHTNEILALIQLTTIIGIHTMTLGVPILQKDVEAITAGSAP